MGEIKMKFKFGAVIVGLLLLVMPSQAQVTTPGLQVVPLGYCQMTAVSSSAAITGATCVGASFTATGKGTALTTSSVTGVIKVGAQIAGTGVTAGTYIVSQTSGTTGGAGVYVTSAATTSSAQSLTAGGIPRGATLAYIQAESKNLRYRDDGAAPTTGIGVQIAAGASILYAGTMSALRFIEESATAKINILFYRSP
jgi:hypothetical protein